MTKTMLFLFTCFSICLSCGCRESVEQIPEGSFRLTCQTLVDSKDLIVKHVIIEACGQRHVEVTQDGDHSSVSPLEPRDTDAVRVEITFVATLTTRSDAPNRIKWLIQLKSRNATAGGPSTFPVETESLDDILQLDLQDGLHPLGHDLVVGKFQGEPIVLLVK
jgi:hypothetical protein